MKATITIKQELVNGRQEWVMRVNGAMYFSNGTRAAVDHAKSIFLRDNA